MKELAIGEEIRIRCVEGGNCFKCSLFRRYGPCGIGKEKMPCTIRQRTDHKNVHFEIIDDVPEIHSGNILTEAQKQTIIDSFYTCQDKWVAKRTIEMIEEMLNQKDKDNGSN